MTVKKITVDNSVRYIAESEQTKKTDIKSKKAGSLPRKQNKNFSKNNKKIVKDFAAGGFGILN